MRISHLAIGLILESEVTVIEDQYQCVKAYCKYLRSIGDLRFSRKSVVIALVLWPYIHASFIRKCMYLFTSLY